MNNLKIIITLFFILFAPVLAHADMQLLAPDKVNQGRAFLITIQNDEPFSGTLIWNEKKIPINSQGEQNEHTAQALLAIARNDTGVFPMTFTSTNSESVTASIEAVPVPWKEDHIQGVAPKFINPPAEENARIIKERELGQKVLQNIEESSYWSLPFYRPVKGTISSAFGGRRVYDGQPRSPHNATDMRGGIGVPIHSVATGKVVIADNFYYSGNVAYIDHGQGVISVYAHMDKLGVKAGDFVEKGQYIGDMGATGRVTGPHLHLSLYVQGSAVDIVPLFTEPIELLGEPTKAVPRPTQ